MFILACAPASLVHTCPDKQQFGNHASAVTCSSAWGWIVRRFLSTGLTSRVHRLSLSVALRMILVSPLSAGEREVEIDKGRRATRCSGIPTFSQRGRRLVSKMVKAGSAQIANLNITQPTAGDEHVDVSEYSR